MEWLSKREVTAFFVVVFIVHKVAFAEKFSPDTPCFVGRVFFFRPEVWSGHRWCPSQMLLSILLPLASVMSLMVVTWRKSRHWFSRIVSVLVGSNRRKSSMRLLPFTQLNMLMGSMVLMLA